MASYHSSIPSNAELISGQDVNANVGIESNIFQGVLGCQRLDNHNMKVKDILFLL